MARVQLLVSTGPPKRLVPSLDGLDAAQIEQALREAGFAPAVEEQASSDLEAGAVISVTPSPGTRVPLGSTVTILVAREPRWEGFSHVESTEDADEQEIVVPEGARLVLQTTDTSPFGAWGGKVDVKWSGDEEGETELRAGESVDLSDVTDRKRVIVVEIDVKGAAHWRLAVELWR